MARQQRRADMLLLKKLTDATTQAKHLASVHKYSEALALAKSTLKTMEQPSKSGMADAYLKLAQLEAAAGDAASSLHMYGTAFAMHQRGLEASMAARDALAKPGGKRGTRSRLSDAENEVIAGWASVANDLRLGGNHEAAARAISRAQQALVEARSRRAAARPKRGDSKTKQETDARAMSQAAQAIAMLASDVLSCAGQAQSALERFELARRDIVEHAATGKRDELLPAVQIEALRNRTLRRAATAGEQDADADAVVEAIKEAEAAVKRRAATDIIVHASLLARAADEAEASPANATPVPSEDHHSPAPALRRRWAEQVSRLVASGARPSVWQLPGHVVGGLLARPWHDAQPSHGAPWGGFAAALQGSSASGSLAVARAVGRVSRLLERAAPALQAEWDRLLAGEALERETECLHVSEGAGAGPAEEAGPPSDRLRSIEGQWARYSVNGFWLGDRLSTEAMSGEVAAEAAAWAGLRDSTPLPVPFPCSADTPVLCSVAAAAAAVGREEAAAAADSDPGSRLAAGAGSGADAAGGVLRPLRAGYSALAPGVSIRPHHGRTDAQLKFHVGVRVPRRGGGPGLGRAEAEAAEAALENATAAGAGQSSAAGAGRCAAQSCAGLGADPRGVPDPWAAGLVPMEACAALRVTGPDDAAAVGRGEAVVVDEWRVWGEGRVFLFDDSFQHEVRNVCHEHRVIVQLVIEHPDLTLGRAAMGDAAKTMDTADAPVDDH